MMIQYYAYLHVNGNIHVKRYFDAKDVSEAQASNFVQSVFGPFEAPNQKAAYQIAKEHFS